MDEWWRSEFISCHLFWILFFSNFLHSIYFFAQSQSLLLSLGLSFSLLSSFSLIFSPGFSSWPSQASSWCHFNIWQGVGLGGNRSQNWNDFSTAGCWCSGGRMRKAASSLCSTSFRLMKKNWCDAKFPFWPQNLIFLTWGDSSGARATCLLI